MSGVSSALVSAATLLAVTSFSKPSTARGAGAALACFDRHCGVYLPAELDGRAVPVNARLWYSGTVCPGFTWSVEYADGTLPEVGPAPLVLNGSWYQLPYLFEVGREVVVRSEPRCWQRSLSPTECRSDFEDECCQVEQQPLQDVAHFVVAEADEVPPEAPTLMLSCRDDGLVEIQVQEIASDAHAVQFGVRGVNTDFSVVWSDSPTTYSYTRIEGFCNAPGDIVNVPRRVASPGEGGWEAKDGQIWFGARAIDVAGHFGAVQEVLLDTASCERVESDQVRTWPIACKSAAWPLAPDFVAESPLAAEFATPLEENIQHTLEVCFPEELESEHEDSGIVPSPDVMLPTGGLDGSPGLAPDAPPVVVEADADVRPEEEAPQNIEDTGASGGCTCRAQGPEGAGAGEFGLALLAGLIVRRRRAVQRGS